MGRYQHPRNPHDAPSISTLVRLTPVLISHSLDFSFAHFTSEFYLKSSAVLKPEY